MSKITNPKNQVTKYEYDTMGNVTEFVDESGVKTTYRYDDLNRVVEIEDMLGNVTKLDYTPFGKVAWREDALGNRVAYDYDGMGRLVTITDAEGYEIHYNYDDAGNLVKVIDQMDEETNYHYDELNRLVTVVDALNQKVEYDYDANNNMVGMINGEGETYRYEYDELNRVIAEVNYQENRQSFDYDPNGNLIQKTDFNQNITTYDYDELNRMIQVLFADSTSKEYEYDANGNLTKALNQNAEQNFYYDELSRLVKAEVNHLDEIDPENWTIDYTYNAVGLETQVTVNGPKLPEARATLYHYDDLNRLVQVELPDGGDVKYQYDELHRVIEKINANSTGTSYSFTPRGQYEKIVHWEDKNNFRKKIDSYAYLYNPKGQRSYQVEGKGEVQAFQYDDAGRIERVYYPYDDKKKLEDFKERIYLGETPIWKDPFDYGVSIQSGLSSSQQLSLEDQILEYTTDLVDTIPTDIPGVSYLNLTQGENALPFVNLLSVETEVEGQLDSLYQDIRTNNGESALSIWGKEFWVEEFDYDANNNVTSKRNGWGEIDYSYEGDRLMSAGQRSYSYDQNGNLIQEQLGDLYAEYEYNMENRMVRGTNYGYSQFYSAQRAYNGEIRYQYDALGRRIEKTVDPLHGTKQDVTHYLYEGLGVNVLLDYEVEGMRGNKKKTSPYVEGKLQEINEYHYGMGQLVALKHIKNPDQQNAWELHGDPLRNLSFYHYDALGSVAMTTGKNGQAIERYEYDVYGNAYDGWFSHNTHNDNPYGFTGQRYDRELGIYNFAYRDYNPHAMRWTTPDPVKDGMNWYGYVGSDPVNYVDPLGLAEEESDKNNDTAESTKKVIKGLPIYRGNFKYEYESVIKHDNGIKSPVEAEFEMDKEGNFIGATISYKTNGIKIESSGKAEYDVPGMTSSDYKIVTDLGNSLFGAKYEGKVQRGDIEVVWSSTIYLPTPPKDPKDLYILFEEVDIKVKFKDTEVTNNHKLYYKKDTPEARFQEAYATDAYYRAQLEAYQQNKEYAERNGLPKPVFIPTFFGGPWKGPGNAPSPTPAVEYYRPTPAYGY